MALDTAFYAAGQILPGPSSLPASLMSPYWNADGTFGGWLPSTAPAGSGTELQYRASSTTFGAIPGSSYSAFVLTIPNPRFTNAVSNDGALDVSTSFIQSFRKSRGPYNSPTVITTGDDLGVINFQGYSGAAGYVTGAQIRAVSEGTIATTRVPAKIVFATGTDAAPTVLTDRMTIDSAGAVTVVASVQAASFKTSANVIKSNAQSEIVIRNAADTAEGIISVQEIHTRQSGANLDVYGNAAGTSGVGTAFWWWSGSAWTKAVHVINGTTGKVLIFPDSIGNVGIGQSTFGTDANKVLALATGAAPSTSPADCFQFYSADQAAGNACPHIRTENGSIVKLFQASLIADPSGGGTQDAEARTAINSILDLLIANGLMAAA